MSDESANRRTSGSAELINAVLSRSSDHIAVIDAYFHLRWSSPHPRFPPRPAETVLDYVHPDDLVRVTAAFRRVLAADDAVESVAYRVSGKDGTVCPVESVFRNCFDDPAIGGVLVNTRTVAVRAPRETGARSERSLDALIEELPQAVAICVGDVVRVVNRALEVVTGRARSELVGLRSIDLFAAADRPAVSALMAATAPGARLPLQEVGVARKDGKFSDVEMSSVSISMDREAAVVLFMTDVTDRKAVRARMSYTDRMASVGTLAAGVAHEVNNPLAFMTMNLAFISEELERIAGEHDLSTSLTDVLSALRDARAGCTRVRQIVRDLRTFSRADQEVRTSVDVVQVLETCLSMMRNEIRHRAQLVKELDPVPWIMANHAQLAQVFLNLLLNAAHAIQEGDAAHNELRVTVRERDGRVVITIRDTGVGIAPENLPRIFDPFFTTKPVGMGTGLGLAICHNVVSGLGGTIRVETEERKGSTFTVELPVASVAEVMTEPPQPLARPRTRLLIVDDDASIGLSLSRALRHGHEVSYAEDGRRALELMREGQQFDAILCDLLMPDMSGSDLYEAMLLEFPQLARRMIFMTAGAFTPIADRFFHSRAQWRIEKPFNVEQVEATISKMLSDVG